jgi:hypothetical protein
LLAGSGGSLAIALGLYVFTAIDMRPLAESCSESGLDSTFECVDRVRRNVRMLSAAMTASTAAVAMAGIGGMMWGKAHAAADYLQRREPRDVRAYRAAGIVGVVLGGTALVGTYVAAVSSAFVGRCRTDDIDCAARTGQGLTAGLGAAALLTTTGAGLLGYGATYPRVLRGWQRRGGQFSMSPSRRGFTLGLSGQF